MKKYQICNKYRYDLWGCINKRPKKYHIHFKKNKSLGRYSYYQFVMKHILKIYYNFNTKKLLNFSYKFNRNYLYTNELRLDVFLTRLNICLTIAESRQIIKKKRVIINSKIITKISHKIKKDDLITFSDEYKLILRQKLLESLFNSNIISFNFNNYTLIDYNTFEIVVINKPTYLNIPYNRFIDIKLILFFLQRTKNCY